MIFLWLKNQNEQLTDIISKSISSIPAIVWLSCLSQITTSLSHENDQINQVLTKIIFYIVQAYPQQALWQMVSVSSPSNCRSRKLKPIYTKLKVICVAL